MDEFGYLSVIISVILGLSIAQLLQNIGQIINARDRVRMYWPAMGWAVLLLVIDIQAWWAMFGYRYRHQWTFVQFTIVLFEAIMLYLLAAIVLGMSYTGLVLSGVSTTWFQSFVGFLLLFAVIVNLGTAGIGARLGVIRKS